MRNPVIAGNWKMNGSIEESKELATGLRRQMEDPGGVEVLVCPPPTALAAVAKAIDGSPIKLGAQNMHWEAKGAFTGETSPTQLLDLGVTHVILGHSERRHIMGESNDMVNLKVQAAFTHGLIPILCVGELLEERNMKVTKEVIERQIEKGLKELTAGQVSDMIIAYEPVWAIGTGMTATPHGAQDVHHFIRNLVARHFDTSTAANVRIQYGGSVKPDNIKDLMGMEDIDGALVGGASLQASSFVQIVRYKE